MKELKSRREKWLKERAELMRAVRGGELCP